MRWECRKATVSSQTPHNASRNSRSDQDVIELLAKDVPQMHQYDRNVIQLTTKAQRIGEYHAQYGLMT